MDNYFRHLLILYIISTSTSVSASIPQSNICWDSVWYNESSPTNNNRSDYEHQSSVVLNSICTTGSVVSAQCKDEKGEAFTSFKNDTSNMYIATCSVVTGLICTPYNNTQKACPDFAIQYSCRCATTAIATMTPPIHLTSTLAQPYLFVSRWTSWINTDSPYSGDGDFEAWTKYQQAVFCTEGRLIFIECATIDGIPSYSSGEIMQCTLEGGSVCLNVDNYPVPCSDYKIRYFCTYEDPINAHVGMNTGDVTTVSGTRLISNTGAVTTVSGTRLINNTGDVTTVSGTSLISNTGGPATSSPRTFGQQDQGEDNGCIRQTYQYLSIIVSILITVISEV